MPADNEPVKPAPFEAVRPAPAGAPPPVPDSRRGQGKWVLPALGALLLLALLVVFWLPGRLEPPTAAPAPSPEQQAPPAPTPAPVPNASDSADPPAAETASPWSDAQLARLRLEAQDVLAELLDLQFALEERGVQHWGQAQFAQAAARAEEGDAHYREQAYEAATAHYRAALSTLQALRDSMPAELERLLDAAEAAIEAVDPPAAAGALDVAQQIEPDSARGAALDARLAVLPGVAELLDTAQRAETGGDLTSAQLALEQASTLDPAHRHVATELERVANAARLRAFRRAMSDGYAALEEENFDAARQFFRNAGKLLPDSAEAANALLEVNAAETAGDLANLKVLGFRHERREEWQQAVATYERALAIDPNVLFASEGLARSRPRAELDSAIRAILDEPERLEEPAVAERAAGYLDAARAISPAGEVLAAQVAQLQSLLRLANTPVTVTLRSDQQTEVVVYKVARLGRFQERQLELRPGTYTAVGSRNGYRDVRREFRVSHDNGAVTVTVICTEPI